MRDLTMNSLESLSKEKLPYLLNLPFINPRGQAFLLHGSGSTVPAVNNTLKGSETQGWRAGLALAMGWLCHTPLSHRHENGHPCQACSSCHAISVHTHPDLFVLMPEATAIQQNWPLSEKAQFEIDEKKRKPSKEIRIDDMRSAIDFSQRTAAQRLGKVVLVYPAESMNSITANALLKTLEEPSGDLKFVLISHAMHQLLPTIRSRCLVCPLPTPPTPALIAEQKQLPKILWQSDTVAAALPWCKDMPIEKTIDLLQKMCHDMVCIHMNAEPRFFASNDLPKSHKIPSLMTLMHWQTQLLAAVKTAQHPFNSGLMLEALFSQAHCVLRDAVSKP